MRKNYIMRSLLAVAVLSASNLSCLAQDEEPAYDFRDGDNLCYNYVSQEEATVEVTCLDIYGNAAYVKGDVSVPENVSYNGKTYTVVGIGQDSFFGCYEMKSISMPPTVTYVGSDAFSECRDLASVIFSDNLEEIGSNAFVNCSSLKIESINSKLKILSSGAFAGCSSIENLTLPNTLEEIGYMAFWLCENLQTVNIPAGIKILENNTFQDCTKLTRVTFDENSTLTQVGPEVFARCSMLSSINLPASLEDIGNGSFYSCSMLEALEIPTGVSKIGADAFNGCSLQNVTIPAKTESIGLGAFDNNPKLISISVDNANEYYSSIDGILYDKGVSTILFCPQGRESVVLPTSVTKIGKNAFMNCLKFVDFIVPNTINQIEASAFKNCINLESLTLGSGLLSIGNYVFFGCNNIKAIHCLAMVPPATGDEITFDTTLYSVTELYVPKGAIEAYKTTQAEWRLFANIEEEGSVDVSEIENPDDQTIRVYDMNGILRFSGKFSDFEQLPEGIYTIVNGRTSSKVFLRKNSADIPLKFAHKN